MNVAIDREKDTVKCCTCVKAYIVLRYATQTIAQNAKFMLSAAVDMYILNRRFKRSGVLKHHVVCRCFLE